MTTTYHALCKDAGKLRGAELRADVEQLIDSAYTNANDTIYVEKAAHSKEWDRIFTGSLGGLLTERGVDPRTIAWFAKRGITG